MINKTEKEILKNWKDNQQMIVSIICVAYNQDYCISGTLDGLLMQKTSFPFEILISDDASTDRTTEIIKEYEDKFPNIIKPLYQSENQFSQGINTVVPLLPRVKGKYVALCDGDDYWVDEDKLEIQVGAMEKHLDVDMSFHPANILTGGKIGKVVSKYSDKNKIITPQEVILGGGEFCTTESLMFRTKLISSLPEWVAKVITLDYVLQIMGAANGGALYIDRCMTVHRIGYKGSWTTTMFHSTVDSEKRKKLLLSFIQTINLLNNHYDNKFKKEFDKMIHNKTINFISNIALDTSLRKEIFDIYKATLSKKQIILWHLLYGNKSLLNALKLIKRILLKGKREEVIRKRLGKLHNFLKS